MQLTPAEVRAVVLSLVVARLTVSAGLLVRRSVCKTVSAPSLFHTSSRPNPFMLSRSTAGTEVVVVTRQGLRDYDVGGRRRRAVASRQFGNHHRRRKIEICSSWATAECRCSRPAAPSSYCRASHDEPSVPGSADRDGLGVGRCHGDMGTGAQQGAAKIKWTFRVADARRKLHWIYPS